MISPAGKRLDRKHPMDGVQPTIYPSLEVVVSGFYDYRIFSAARSECVIEPTILFSTLSSDSKSELEM